MARAILYIGVVFITGLLVYLDYDKLSLGFNDLALNLIPSLLVLIIIGFFFEAIARKDIEKKFEDLKLSISTNASKFAQEFYKVAASDENLKGLFLSAIKTKMDNERYANAFVAALERMSPHHNFVSDSVVRITMVRGKNSKYEIILEEDALFRSDENSFIVCLTTDKDVVTKLANYSSFVDRVYVPSNMECPKDIEEASKLIKVFAEKSLDGTPKMEELKGQVISERAALKILREVGVGPAERSSCILLSYSIESDLSAGVRVSTEYRELDFLKTGYCYWSPDRATHVQTIEFDYGDIQNDIVDVSSVSFCLAPSLRVVHDDKSGKIRYNINDWMFPGQGVIVRWGVR